MKKVLIVDDRPEVRELIKVTLELSPYDVLTASSAKETFAVVDDVHPDLILLDVMLGVDSIDGLELCRQLKNNPATSDIFVILLTSKGQEWDMEAGLKAGADRYIVKPFSPAALLDLIEHVLT